MSSDTLMSRRRSEPGRGWGDRGGASGRSVVLRCGGKKSGKTEQDSNRRRGFPKYFIHPEGNSVSHLYYQLSAISSLLVRFDFS